MTSARIETEGFQRWSEALRLMTVRVDVATKAATQEAGRHNERSVRAYLHTYAHPAGTPTPSPPGGPPAWVSGDLARSVRRSPTVRKRLHVYEVSIGPTERYGRIQERGGVTGRGYRTRLPARPFQKPVTRHELAMIRRIYVQHWREAIRL